MIRLCGRVLRAAAAALAGAALLNAATPTHHRSSGWRPPLRAPGPETLAAPAPPEVGPEIWTLQDVLRFALERNGDIQVAAAEAERQDAFRWASLGEMLPQIAALASWDQRAESTIDRAPSETTLPPNRRTSVAEESQEARVEARQVLFDGFSRWNRYRTQALRADASGEQLADLRERTLALARQAYDAVLLRQLVLATQEGAVAKLEQLRDFARRRQQVGEGTEFDVLRLETELQNSRSLLAQARSELVQSEQVLGRVIGVRFGADDTPRPRLAGSLDPRSFGLSLTASLAQAREHRRDLAGARLLAEAARRAVWAARGSLAPTIEGFANYAWRSSYYDADTINDGWTVGVTATINLFDGFQRRQAIRAQLADERAARQRVQNLTLQVETAVHELFATYEQAGASIEAQRASIALAERTFAQAERGYELGQLSLEEVFNAELALRRARISLGQAIFNRNSAVAQLEYATGLALGRTPGGVARPAP